MSSPVCMACVPASYVDLECKHLFESADVAAAGAQGCSCDSLVYVYLRREQDGVHCLSNLTKIKNNIGNVYSSHCVHIHHVYSSPCVHIHHVYSSTSILNSLSSRRSLHFHVWTQFDVGYNKYFILYRPFQDLFVIIACSTADHVGHIVCILHMDIVHACTCHAWRKFNRSSCWPCAWRRQLAPPEWLSW